MKQHRPKVMEPEVGEGLSSVRKEECETDRTGKECECEVVVCEVH